MADIQQETLAVNADTKACECVPRTGIPKRRAASTLLHPHDTKSND
jgi:hypothetical protein